MYACLCLCTRANCRSRRENAGSEEFSFRLSTLIGPDGGNFSLLDYPGGAERFYQLGQVLE